MSLFGVAFVQNSAQQDGRIRPSGAWGVCTEQCMHACMVGGWGMARTCAVGCWRAVGGSVSGLCVCVWGGFVQNSAQQDGR